MKPNLNDIDAVIRTHVPLATDHQSDFAAARVLHRLRVMPHHQGEGRGHSDLFTRSASSASWNRILMTSAVAAAVLVFAVTTYFPRAEWLATVEAADGSKYTVEPNTLVSAKDPRGLQLTLKDGARVEMRSASALSLEAAADGIGIRLLAGDIIVNAVAQPGRSLSVRTRNLSIAVAGTTSLVKTVEGGTRVAAIAGNVRVHERGLETVLHPGEQFSTTPTLAARPLRDDLTWSRNATEHLAKVNAFMKGVAQTTTPLTPLARQTNVTSASTFALGASADRQAPAAQAAALEFEEASVRPCDPDNVPAAVSGRGGGGPNSLYMTPGRLYVLCMTPATLIRTAYGYTTVTQEVGAGSRVNYVTGRWEVIEAPERQEPIGAGGVFGAPPEDGQRVRGGPDWVLTERYTIEAVAEGLDPGNDACLPRFSRGGRPSSPNGPCRTVNATSMSGPMLRALLERRFKLKAHVETEQVPALALVVAPGGLKIKPAAPDSCTPAGRLGGPSGPPGGYLVMNFPGRPTLSDVRGGQKRVCGYVLHRNGPNRVLVAGGSTFSALAQVLGRRELRELVGPVRVYDKTGITDMFDWILEFAPEEDPGPSSPSEPTNVPPGPRIFDALQQQLGLRLEPTHAPRDVIVIDAIERPSPN
ncbi:MAG: TIGR03435 family protein [Vicinamibacterales bacterium]